MTALISARGLRKHFPLEQGLFSRGPRRTVRAVDGVDLDIAENETLALVGESGSGKTTLGMLILGLHEPTAGSVAWSGSSLATATAEERLRFRRSVQVVFQDPYGSLNPRATVRSIIARPLRLHGTVPADGIDREVERLLELVGLHPARVYIDRFPHEFSGGQRQRIAIARALALKPRLIIADEPVSALDVSVRAQILTLLAQLKRDFGLSILFTTHDLGVVRYIADRVAVMYLGKVVETAPSETFFVRTHHPYARMLLGSALSPNPAANLAHRTLDVHGEPPSPIDPPSGCRFRTRCPFAFARCAVEEPPLREVAPQHRAACHLDPADIAQTSDST
jgi:peptide/nickel transport system ATP-binding protein/oligopeptide transport system ATP-binding protein